MRTPSRVAWNWRRWRTSACKVSRISQNVTNWCLSRTWCTCTRAFWSSSSSTRSRVYVRRLGTRTCFLWFKLLLRSSPPSPSSAPSSSRKSNVTDASPPPPCAPGLVSMPESTTTTNPFIPSTFTAKSSSPCLFPLLITHHSS